MRITPRGATEDINLEGEVSGTDLDANGVQYGFFGDPFFNDQGQFDSESATATPSANPQDPKVTLPAKNDRNGRLPRLTAGKIRKKRGSTLFTNRN